jgi:sulfofructose kinase
MAPPGQGSQSSAHVLCIGGVCVDHVLELDALPSGEGKQLARHSRWGGGGPAATAAVAISRLGAGATWYGLVGDDLAGEMLTEMLQQAGVAVGEGSVIKGAATSISEVLVDADGHRWLGYYRGEGLPSTTGDVDDHRVASLLDLSPVHAVMCDRSCSGLATKAFEMARERGVPRVVDVEESRGREIGQLTGLADHVIFSAAGLSSYTGLADPAAALRVARRRLPGATVGVTQGPSGSVFLTAEGLLSVPAPVVKAKDTTGCGDVFHGAYALALGEGLAVPGAAVFATAVAALKAVRGDAWLGMPTRAEVDALIEKGWA